jgi:DNA-binding NarL/FixJ family response regulator
MIEPYDIAPIRVVLGEGAPDGRVFTTALVIELVVRVQHRDGPADDAEPLDLAALPDETHHDDALTQREQEVLALVADGRTNREIAEQLILSEATVKQYAKHIYGKLGVTSRTQAALHPQAQALHRRKRAA